MKALIGTTVLAILFVVAPTPCFALWEIAPVDKDTAKKMGIEIRSVDAGPKQVRVELEFKLEGELKGFSRVDLRLGGGDNPLVTAPLQEDRSKPGRLVVSFNADRAQIEKISLWIFVPETLGGVVYEISVKDFVEVKKEK
ncbi:MAG TPA: hypothetical protein VKS79_12935 [Gemmataceae bacterium]|nr:hypothetical protein [Gemmataceae bacterium]